MLIVLYLEKTFLCKNIHTVMKHSHLSLPRQSSFHSFHQTKCYWQCSYFLNVTLVIVQVITIGRERYTVGEALFQPSILGLEAHGIVEQLVRCISTVSSDNHRQLLENTVLCGGTASMTGEFYITDLCISYAVISIFAFELFSSPIACSCWNSLVMNESVPGLFLVAFNYCYI